MIKVAMKRRAILAVTMLAVLCGVVWTWAGELRVEYDEGVGFDSKDYADHIVSVKPTKVTASSTLEGNQSYRPQNATDGNDKTAWCEGVSGPGKGEWIRYEFAPSVEVAAFAFTPKYAKDKVTLFNNGRVKRLRIEMEGGFSHTAEFSDDDEASAFGEGQQIDYSAPLVDLKGDPKVKNPVKTTWVKFTIEEVFVGKKYQDTCISEIGVMQWK